MTKTPKALPIVLDRLDHALKSQGLTIKRAQLLEIAAGAFGYRNSNEFTAAAKAGDINPPYATPVGVTTLPSGQRIVVAMDPLANAPYAIDESFLEQIASEERREEIGITPYGHMVRLEPLFEESLDELTSESDSAGHATRIYVGVINHGEGENVYLAIDRDALLMQVADYCRENWNSIADHAEDNENPATMSDCRVIDAYFEICSDQDINEYFSETVEEVIGRIEPVIEQGKRYPDRYEVVHQGNDAPLRIIDLIETRVIGEVPRSEKLEDDIAMAQEIAGRLNGNIVPEYVAGAHERLALERIVKELNEGVNSDIWYDAHEFMDDEDENNSDTILFNGIARMQMAINDAASFIEKVLQNSPETQSHTESHAVSPKKTTTDPVIAEQTENPVWLTDRDGTYLGRISKDHLQKIGESYHEENGNTLLLIPSETSVNKPKGVLNATSVHKAYTGGVVLYQNRKMMAIEVEFPFEEKARDRKRGDAGAYAREKQEVINRLGGSILVRDNLAGNQCLVIILLPFSIAHQSASSDDWENALSWLLLPEAERTGKITANFIPQVDIGRSVVTAEPLGETHWDATFDVLLAGREAAKEMHEDGVYDDYAINGLLSPQWVKDWTNLHPFDVEVEGMEYFFDF